MSSSNPTVIEPQIISLKPGAELAIGAGGNWMIGTSTQNLHPVTLGSLAAINDDTFGFSAVDVEGDGQGGFLLFVQSNNDEDLIVEVRVNSNGAIDPSSIQLLSAAELADTEILYGIDLNGNGGVGSAPVALQGGAAVSLYVNALGEYLVGSDLAALHAIMVGGQPLDDTMIPEGWAITDVGADTASGGYFIYLSDADSNLYSAQLDAAGNLIGFGAAANNGAASSNAALGEDISGGRSVPLAPGWYDNLQNTVLKSAVTSSLANGGRMDYQHLVKMMGDFLQSHISAGKTPITSADLSDLQAISARGKAMFGDSSGSTSATDYLSYIFSKMVDGSVANQFYTGGANKSAPLGSLVAGSSTDQLQKLVDKWLLGKDLPSPLAGGDTATGKAATTVGVYEHSAGSLFVNGIAPADIKQGSLGDCYFAASLVELASVSPASVSSMFVANPAVNSLRTWGVRFYDADGVANWVTVDDELPVASKGSVSLTFGGNPANDLDGEIWFSLAEKAYVQANSLKILPRGPNTGDNAYFSIEGGFGDPLAQILGHKITAYLLSSSGFNLGDNPYIRQEEVNTSDPAAMSGFQNKLIQAVSTNKPVWIASFDKTQDAYGNTLLTSGHAFVATADSSPSSAQVWNPWGVSVLPNPPANVGYLSPFSVSLVGLATDPNLIIMIG